MPTDTAVPALLVAAALDAAERRGIERAARLVAEQGSRYDAIAARARANSEHTDATAASGVCDSLYTKIRALGAGRKDG